MSANQEEPTNEAPPALATEANILDHFTDDLHRRSVVGEDRLAKINYLAVTSRFLERPISLVVKGPSSAGKSHTVEQTLRFFPKSAYIFRTAMSPKALVHTTESFRHRMLVIAEAAGMQGGVGTLLIRSLLSEGQVAYETVEVTPTGFQTRLLRKEGPTGLIITTTRIRIHPENETRILTVPINDSPEQTRAIMRAIAAGEEGDHTLERWHELHKWLAKQDHGVVVPFATILSDVIPAVAVRLRRDFTLLLNLVKAHALLHQATRERDDDGKVIATLEDYAVVRELVCDIFAEGVEAKVPKEVRETVRGVEAHRREHGGEPLSVTDLARRLGLDKSATSRRVRHAIQLGYLQNEEDKKGRPARIVPAEPLPEEVQILPTAEALAELADCCTVAAFHGGAREDAPQEDELHEEATL